MDIKSATFVTSAASPTQFLKRPIPHFVFAGKSNVGKSSILNRLLNRKGLAKTSSTPGKTRLVNYFLINDRLFFVDVPGYGYAKVSKQEQKNWQPLLETYFRETPQIAMIFLLLDIRHSPNKNDRQMIDWLRHFQYPFRILLTKADKLSNNKIFVQRKLISKELGMASEDLIPTSAVSARGIRDVWSEINQAHEVTRKELNKDES
jgi:GTP-binding protein